MVTPAELDTELLTLFLSTDQVVLEEGFLEIAAKSSVPQIRRWAERTAEVILELRQLPLNLEG